jgi:DNA-binding CsgD family transcriptional regulator/tetratricopeptide (TPR) repeat protein
LFDELLGEARAGEPVTVFVCGEAGAGKTRLVSEATAVARDGGARTLVGSCTAVGRRSFAFAPFVEALGPLVREPASGGGDGGSPVGPGLVRLVSGPEGGAVGRESPDPGQFEVSAQLRLFEEMLDGLERAAAPGGLLVVIEDLHWADPSSRGLFEFLSRSLRGAAVVLVGTVRTDEPDDAGFLAWLAEVQRGPRAIRVDLEPFGREELTDLVEGVLGRPPSPELVGRVYERSGGNALLAEELLAAGEGVLVPTTVRGLVLARMAGLSAPARGLLRLAAVAGVRVGHGLLAAAGGLGDDALLAAARELAENHLLVADPSGRGYVFRHALTREAIYDDLLPGERQQLHRAVARALTDDAALGPPAAWAVAEALPEHWFAAGELEEALAASVVAGNAAREVVAVAAALGHYQQALELWDRVADPEAVTGIGRSVLLEGAAEVASGAGEHERAMRYVDDAIGELEHTAAAPIQIGLLYERKAWYLSWAGRMGEFAEWTGRAVALVPSEPPTPGRAHVLAAHALALTVGRARYEEGSPVAAAALVAARRAGARKDEVLAHNVLGICRVMTSTDPQAGIREFDHALAIGREIGDAGGVALASSLLTDALIRLGRLDDVAATGFAAAHIGTQVGALRNEVGLNLFNAAEALFLAGRWDDCEHALERVRDQRAGGIVGLSGLAFIALLQASRGRDEAAATAIADAASLGVVDPDGEGMLRAAQAQIALNQGDLDAAHRAALDGLGTVTASESEPGIATTVALAELALRIEADRAQVARARRDPAEEHGAVESTRTVAVRTLALRVRTAAAAQRPEVTRAHRALAEAEVGRAEGRSEPDAWRTVAGAGAAQGAPQRTAYAQFREAEAVLASRGDRARAIVALAAAHAATRELGAEPLGREIEGLARRARIELTDEPLPATPPASAERGLATLGLTSRELDVLRLLAAGYTNPQIGEALYISRKTASHHVSSVLTKLGVTTRVEAAGVAHRLGLTPDTAAPK